MATFNWVDVILILLLAAAAYYGLRIGLLTLLLMIGGFFSALFITGWLLAHLLPIHDPALLTIVNLNLALIIALFASFKGLDYGKNIHLSLSKGKLRSLESLTG